MTVEPVIDEVVLVGGAPRTPSIRAMLREKFPPPHPPDLCYSVQAEAAVAQGAAIQTAIVSGLVPKHELRNALMLDALPHSIGVLIESKKDKATDSPDDEEVDEEYIPILFKDTPLAAKGYATFSLADIHQKGMTVIAVEDVDDDLPLQRIGEFTFLLQRLEEDDLKSKCRNGVRNVDIGMVVDGDGKFTVSFFDENDPEHAMRKMRFLNATSNQTQTYTVKKSLREKKSFDEAWSREQILLVISCAFMFVLYVATKITFYEPQATTIR